MIHHLHVLLVGLAYVLGFFFIPMFLGLPCELWASKQIQMPVNLTKAWFAGFIVIGGFVMIYLVGLLFI